MQLEKSCEPHGFENKETARRLSGGWQTFDIIGTYPQSRFLVLCDHATNLLPPEYGTLGLDIAHFDRHIAYDIGALPIALELGRLLGARVVYSRFSRLLIDPNRGRDDPTLIMQLSDGTLIPGNVRIDATEIAHRTETYYNPYHEAISAELETMKGRGINPCLVSIHSFTNAWRGVLRKWHAGILWNGDPRLPVPLIHELRVRTDFEIGDNQPYSGLLPGDTIYQHAGLSGLPNALIEIRQDLIGDTSGQMAWASLLAECLGAIVGNAAIAKALQSVDYSGSRTDIKSSV